MSSRVSTSALKAIRPSAFRSFHISRPVLNADLPPTPSSAEALGFKPQTNRQRQLPESLKIDITVSGRNDIINNVPRQTKTYRGNATSKRSAQTPKAGKPQTRPETTKQDSASSTHIDVDFFSNNDLVSDPITSAAPSSSAPRSRRTLRAQTNGVVSASDSSLPPDVVRRQRQKDSRDRARAPAGSRPRQPGQTQTQTQGKNRSGPGNRDRQPRTGRGNSSREKKVMLPRRQLTFETSDHSEHGLFGKKSLISDGTSSSVEPKMGHARRSLSLRQAKSASSFPSIPLPILSTAPSRSAEQAIQIASWTAALNGSIPRSGKSQLTETVTAQLRR